MKTKILPFVLLIAFCISGCQKLDIEKDTPECIEELIRDFKKEQSCNEGVNVKRYTFQDNTVYVFDPGQCGADMTSEVIDANCNSLGFLGGIAGNNEINGESFSNAIFEAVTWEK